jgi:hypothetical protein
MLEDAEVNALLLRLDGPRDGVVFGYFDPAYNITLSCAHKLDVVRLRYSFCYAYPRMDHNLLNSRHFVVAGASAIDAKAVRQQQMPSYRALEAAMSYKRGLSIAHSAVRGLCWLGFIWHSVVRCADPSVRYDSDSSNMQLRDQSHARGMNAIQILWEDLRKLLLIRPYKLSIRMGHRVAEVRDAIYSSPFIRASKQEQVSVQCLPFCSLRKNVSMSSSCLFRNDGGRSDPALSQTARTTQCLAKHYG